MKGTKISGKQYSSFKIAHEADTMLGKFYKTKSQMCLMETPLKQILAKSAHEYRVAGVIQTIYAERHTFVYLRAMYIGYIGYNGERLHIEMDVICCCNAPIHFRCIKRYTQHKHIDKHVKGVVLAFAYYVKQTNEISLTMQM